MADSGCISDEQSVIAIKKVFELEKIVYDNAITSDSWGAAKLQLDIAKLYARLGNISEAVEHQKSEQQRPKRLTNALKNNFFPVYYSAI